VIIGENHYGGIIFKFLKYLLIFLKVN